MVYRVFLRCAWASLFDSHISNSGSSFPTSAPVSSSTTFGITRVLEIYPCNSDIGAMASLPASPPPCKPVRVLKIVGLSNMPPSAFHLTLKLGSLAYLLNFLLDSSAFTAVSSMAWLAFSLPTAIVSNSLNSSIRFHPLCPHGQPIAHLELLLDSVLFFHIKQIVADCFDVLVRQISVRALALPVAADSKGFIFPVKE